MTAMLPGSADYTEDLKRRCLIKVALYSCEPEVWRGKKVGVRVKVLDKSYKQLYWAVELKEEDACKRIVEEIHKRGRIGLDVVWTPTLFSTAQLEELAHHMRTNRDGKFL